MERAILNFICKNKKRNIVKTILNKRTSGGITIPDLKLHYKTIVIKTTRYWYRGRQGDHCNRIKVPEGNPYTYGLLIFDKEAET